MMSTNVMFVLYSDFKHIFSNNTFHMLIDGSFESSAIPHIQVKSSPILDGQY